MSALDAPRPSETEKLLQSTIGSIANRLRAITFCDALFLSLAILCVIFLIVAWLDIVWHLPFSLRQFAVPSMIVASLAVFAILIARRWRTTDSRHVAKRMDSASRTGGQILSGWDMLNQTQQSNAEKSNAETEGESLHSLADVQSLARGIASVAIQQAYSKAKSVDAREAVPWSMLKRSSIALFAASAVIFCFHFVAPNAFATSFKRLFSPSLETPPYTPLVFNVSPGDTKVTFGHSLEITAEISGGAVDQAYLVLGEPGDKSADRVSMFPGSGGNWQAVLPRVTEPTQYFVTANRGRSNVFRIEVIQTPKIERVKFEVTPPSYTGMPTQAGQHPKDQIAGLQGTQVKFSVSATRPLASGTVSILSTENDDERKTVSLQPIDSGPNSVGGVVELRESGRWAITVRGTNGVPNENPATLDVELLIDQSPIVRITEPRQKSFATATTQIPVRILAEDDYGVRRIRLYRIVDGSRPSPIDLPADKTRVVQGNWILPLDKLGVEVGQKFTLFARADDTRPAKDQGSESAIVEIEVISQSDFNRMSAARQGNQMLENKFRQARRMMDQLASEAAEIEEALKNVDPKDAKATEQLQKRLEQLRDKMNEVADQLEKLAEQELPLAVDPHWNELLRKQAQALRDAAKAAEKLQSDGKPNEEQLEKLANAINQLRQQQDEQINQPLEALRKIAPLIAAESKFVRLVARQRAVVDKLDAFRKMEKVADAADRQQIADLRDEEAEIRKALDDLLIEIANSAEQLGDDPDLQALKASSLEFVEAVRNSVIDSELVVARGSLAADNGSEGYAHALTALQEMEKFLQQCNANGQQAANCLKNKFAPGMQGDPSGGGVEQMLSQMGLNPGQQSGYSMRGATGQNVGLYGNQPFAQPQGRGRGDNGRLSPARGKSARDANSNHPGSESMHELPTTSRSTSRDVPLRYRKQTQRYLRRLAEQLEI